MGLIDISKVHEKLIRGKYQTAVYKELHWR